jgi:DNA-dependent protein kinase catalytic subunit
MLNIIIERCEHIFFFNQQQQEQQQEQQQQMLDQQQAEVFDEKIYQLPSFLESLSYVCNEIDDELPEGSVQTLEKLIILTIEMYPKLKKRYSKHLCLAILSLFTSISIKKSRFYPDFLSRSVYQSLIRIFSCKTNYYFMQVEQEDRQEGSEQVGFKNKQTFVTSMDYKDLWHNLLNICQYDDLGSTNILTVYDKRQLISLIYDEYVDAIISILNKLDFNATRTDKDQQNMELSDFASSNPIHGLKPRRPRDFEILINLVDFTRELLIDNNFNLFHKWMFKFIKEIITFSNNFPFISAFYKLNTLAMRIAIKIDYFAVEFLF